MKTYQFTSHAMTWHLTTKHMPSPRVISQPTTKFRISPGNQLHQNRSPHHNHGTADSFTQKTRFEHRSCWSPCADSIGKFFLWLIVSFLWNFRPRLVRLYLYCFLFETMWKCSLNRGTPYRVCGFDVAQTSAHQMRPATLNCQVGAVLLLHAAWPPRNHKLVPRLGLSWITLSICFKQLLSSTLLQWPGILMRSRQTIRGLLGHLATRFKWKLSRKVSLKRPQVYRIWLRKTATEAFCEVRSGPF